MSSYQRQDFFDDPAAPPATTRVPGVTVAVFDADQRVLLSRRADNGLWVLPGGRLELGERVAEAGAREVLEETGVEIEVTGMVGIYSDPGHVTAYSSGLVMQELVLALRGRPWGGFARPDDLETTEVAWFSHEEAKQLDLHPIIRTRIDDAFIFDGPIALR